MKKNFLFIWLIVPLGLTSVALFVLSFYMSEPWRSLLINLTAGFLGSIITVFFVEKVIRWNENEKWAKVLRHVGNQVNFLANGTCSSVRTALGLPPPKPENEYEVIHSPHLMREMMIRLIEEELLPNIAKLPEIDHQTWKTFAMNMQGSVTDTERIMSLFGRNLDPMIMELVLDIHEEARGLLGHYMTLPDLLGVPFEELKPNRRGESMVPYMRAEYKLIVAEAEQLLRTCAQLLRDINSRFPNK